MGDRSSCILTVGGILDVSDIDTLAQALTDAYCEDADPAASLLSGVNEFFFDEVNYAAENDGLVATLKKLGLSRTWANSQGDEYSEGVICHNAATDELAEFSTNNGEIVLSTIEARDPVKLADALRWEQFRNRLKLTVLQTGHEAMAHAADKKIENFLDPIDPA